MRKNVKGITLVALVITIIILIILAGITISQLSGSGLFENAKLAKEKSDEAQEKEEGILSDYENKIGEYVDGTRETSSKIKSLINKEDGVYNTTEGGYVFSTPTTETNITSNNVIKLTDSIENYDYIIFEIDTYRTVSGVSTYTFPNTSILSSTRIKESYSEDVDDRTKTFILVNDMGGEAFNRVLGTFQDSSTMTIYLGLTASSSYTKLRITDIKGIKY